MRPYTLSEMITVAKRQLDKGEREEAIAPKIDGDDLIEASFEKVILVDVCRAEEQAMSAEHRPQAGNQRAHVYPSSSVSVVLGLKRWFRK